MSTKPLTPEEEKRVRAEIESLLTYADVLESSKKVDDAWNDIVKFAAANGVTFKDHETRRQEESEKKKAENKVSEE